MVASIAKMGGGAIAYYSELAREDYYQNGGEPPGKWFGSAAKQLGLDGEVTKEQLQAFLSGFSHSDGSKLVRSAGTENHQLGWDVAFSAPKSVSVAWGLASPENSNRIFEAHNKAVETAVQYLEANAIYSRTGKGGVFLQKGTAAVAIYLHGTSRDEDPNLHSHCLFGNVCIREDGKTGTLQSPFLYEHKMIAGAIYRAALAYHLEKDLNLSIERDRGFFQISGIPKSLCDFFSKRGNAIKAAVGPNASAKDKADAALSTRKVKGHVARNELEATWRKEAKSLGFGQREVDRLFEAEQKKNRFNQTASVDKALTEAIDDLSKTESYFSKPQLLRAVVERLPIGKFNPEKLIAEFDGALKENNDLISLGKTKAEQFFTSKELQDVEKELGQHADRLANRNGKVVSSRTFEAVISGATKGLVTKVAAFVMDHLPERLQFGKKPMDYSCFNDEQIEALKYITSSDGSLKVLSGRAGTGKTTLLSAARECWEAQGLKVIGCAVSGKAAQGLAQSAGMNAETVRMTLMRLETNRLQQLKQFTRQALKAIWKQITYKKGQMKLDRNTVLVIEEASMIGTRDLNSLLKQARKKGTKVVLVGDHRQLPSIDAGSAFERLWKLTEGKELTKTIRHKTPWLNQAANLLADDDTESSLKLFADNNRLALCENENEARRTLIEMWSKHRTKDLRETVVLAGKNSDANALNQLAQDERRRNKELGSSKFTFNGTTYHTGDRIAFHANDRKAGAWNGDRGTIKYIMNPINQYAARFVIELDHGQTITICPGRLKKKSDISLGYASTVHKAQGMTVDKTFFLADDQMMSRQASYVALTRSRYDTFIAAKTTDVSEHVQQQVINQEELAKKMQRDQAKQMADQQRMEIERQEQIRRQQRVQEYSR